MKYCNRIKAFVILFIFVMLAVTTPGTGSAAQQSLLKVHNTYYGFELIEEKSLPDIQSVARVFRHTKSGAQLVYLENADDNKIFSIAFRTPPPDNTGVTHIIEHSVLCGSRKYPVKDPFLQMMKSSLYTYLNASTYPDKTIYPVASRNDKDFRNLMDVYLDAVFYPNFYDQPEIFQQEGWHYELNDKSQPITYKGVVYNEMKGAFSTPEGVLWRTLPGAVLPDTIYGYISGGDPEKIPDLTRVQFLAYHKKYYHPSNSYIYLYGNLNILDTLKYLDEEYLSAFAKKEIDSRIALQPRFEQKRDVTAEYSVLSTDTTADKTYLSMSFVLKPVTDWETFEAFQVLENLLLGSPDAPLKRALIKAGIGKNVYGDISGGLQPIFSIVVTNANEDDKDRFERTIRSTLEEMVAKGIDRELLKATFNISEFRQRETIIGANTKGLLYNQESLNLWLYGGDPILPLTVNRELKQKALSGRYLEQLIRKFLLDNPHSATLVFKPKPGLEQQKTEQINAKLAKLKAGLSDRELEDLVAQTHHLKQSQAASNTPEELAKLPVLSLNDINPKAEPYPLEEKLESGIKVLFHPQFTNEIAYVDLYFDSTAVSQQQLPYLYLLAELLGKVNTDKHNYLQLATELKAKTGGVSFGAYAYPRSNNKEVYYPKFKVSAKALMENLPQMLDLTDEIINSSDFSDQQRLKELLQKIKAQRQAELLNNPTGLAAGRILAYMSPAAAYSEMGNLSFYEFIAELEKSLPDKGPEISRNLADVAKKVFNKNNLLVSVVMPSKDYPKFQQNFSKLVNHISVQPSTRNVYEFELEPRNEGILTAGKVQYVAKAYNYRDLGYEYSGKMKVLQTILNNEYLWNRVRVLGGAYGSSVRFDRSGNILFLSWRDPNLRETLSVYQGVSEYLRNFNPTDRDMENYIISTIGKTDGPFTPYAKGQAATAAYISGLSFTDRQKERDEILATTPEDIRQFAEMFASLETQNYVCVVGSEAKLTENKATFGKVVTMPQ